MSKYIFGYHGQPATAAMVEQDNDMMAAWGQWFQGMGPALVDMGHPAGPSQLLSPGGSVAAPEGTGLTGYSIVEAGSLDEAMGLAKGCPIFAAGGSIEVAELVSM